MGIKELPDDYKGMVVDGSKQYWCFGHGYYRKYNGTVVYRHGKRVLDLAQHGTKEQLKKLINGTAHEKQLNLFGGENELNRKNRTALHGRGNPEIAKT